MSPTSDNLTIHLGAYQPHVEAVLREVTDQRMVTRLWERDPTLWQPEPTDLRHRLGWLQSARALDDDGARWSQFVRDVRAEGYTQALVLGMGGASLAPALFRQLFGADPSALPLAVLDSIDPGAVMASTQWGDPARTLFLVASQSGTTGETLALFNHFYNHVAATQRAQEVGRHFVAITAPQSPLADLATRHRFREVFLADPTIEERYAALSPVGLVPAALVGVDLPRWLAHAEQMQHACGVAGVVGANPGAQLGVLLGTLALAGRDKVTVRTSATLSGLGAWVEHLLAASTGTEGVGLIPIVHEPLGLPTAYGPDRLFVHLGFSGDDEQQQEQILDALAAAGHPVVHIHPQDLYEVGGQVFLWAFATALAGARLGLYPLEPPHVDAATQRAQEAANAYRDTGAFAEEPPAATFDDLRLYGTPGVRSPEEGWLAFLAQGQPGDYVTLQAYLPPPLDIPITGLDTPELTRIRRETTEIRMILMSMCGRIRDKYGLAATFGYGPRARPATGQRPKGDRGRGLVLQLTAEAPHDVPIPTDAGVLTTTLSFGTLQAAQALGDRQTLREASWRLARAHLGAQVVERLRQFNQALV
jgi:transaldolase/glucose-6-phosphate isomerase